MGCSFLFLMFDLWWMKGVGHVWLWVSDMGGGGQESRFSGWRKKILNGYWIWMALKKLCCIFGWRIFVFPVPIFSHRRENWWINFFLSSMFHFLSSNFHLKSPQQIDMSDKSCKSFPFPSFFRHFHQFSSILIKFDELLKMVSYPVDW